jgi:DNA repair protein RadC
MKKESSYQAMCAKCTKLVKIAKCGIVSTDITPLNGKESFVALVREQMFKSSIVAEDLYCFLLSPQTKQITMIHIAHGYQTIKPHPHIIFDILHFAVALQAEAIILVSYPIGSFLPEGLRLITGELMVEAAKKQIAVVDHILFKQNADKIVSLEEDDMLDYCERQYRATLQLAGEQ